MHFTYFSVKRLFLSAMHKVQMPMLRRLGLTPARFDVLFILHQPDKRSSRQRDLWKALGVSRATICKMMKLLERLGFLTRSRWTRKRVYVALTDLGRAVLRHALKTLRLRRRGPVERTTHSIFVKRWWSESACLQELESVQLYTDRLRKTLTDGATHYYPWHPDD